MMNNLFFYVVFLCVGLGSVQTAFAKTNDRLLSDEQNTVTVFERSASKVVYVHRMTTKPSRTRAHLHAVPSGSGSGILWDSKGHVVTNYHVIKGADVFLVTIGAVTMRAKVVGVEPREDLAVLLLKKPSMISSLQTLTPFEMAHVRELKVGQKAIAIGNPFGLDHSLTQGVVSALGRQIPGVGGIRIRNMIQTDAAINPGNSGGPLLDSAGRLMGLNTVIYSDSGSSAGIGFAVPADDISRTVTQLIQYGRVRLAGIGIKPVEPKLAARFGVKNGVLIADVLPNTPAFFAKLRKTHRSRMGQVVLGDIIVGLNGHEINDYDALYHLLSDINVGDDVTLTVLRDGLRIYHRIKTIDSASF